MKLKKVICLLIILLIIQVIFSNYSIGIEEIVQSGENFVNASNEIAITEGNIRDTSNVIYNTLLIIAICIAVIIGAVLGIKYIFSSVEGRAKISEALIPYVIGCFIAFSAFFIWKAIVIVGNSISIT